jgi:[ribosomal protein S5]-alanine N-acetyltransferase
MQRTLHTDRLVLREPRGADAPWVFERWASQPERLAFLEWPPHRELVQTRQLLEWEQARWFKKTGFTWLLVPRGEAHPVGQIQLLPQRPDGRSLQHVRLGYVLAREAQGRGWMREAVQAVVAHALAQPAVWRVDALCAVDNLSSQRLLAAAGLQCEGRLAHGLLQPNRSAVPVDAWLFAAWRVCGTSERNHNSNQGFDPASAT